MPRKPSITVRKDQGGRTALHHAAFINEPMQIEQWFTLKGINVNAQDGYNRTALHDAMFENVDDSHYRVAQILLKNGANINALDLDNRTPLYFVVSSGNITMLRFFLNHKADFQQVDTEGENLLFPAIKFNKYPDIVEALISQGLDVNLRNKKDRTPLHYVALSIKNRVLQYRMAQKLLRKGADVNARDKKGLTPFYYVLKRGSLETIRLFLEKNADLSVMNSDNNQTVLFQAVRNKDAEVTQLMINLGLKVDHRDSEERTPLHEVCENKFNYKVVKCLLRYGSDMNWIDQDEATPITLCIDSLIDRDGKITRGDKQRILELIVLYVNHHDFNILNIDYQPDIEYVWKIILEKVAILETLGIGLHSVLEKTIKKHSKYKNYYKKCQDELLKAVETPFQDSRFTYYNILVDNKIKLNDYVGNEELFQDFELCDFLAVFPIYGLKMDKKVEKAKARRKIFVESADSLSEGLPIFNPKHLIIRDILNCMISMKDLLKFCDEKILL